MKFPKHFVWGVASAAYQVEGAVNEDGRGQSVWDMMCRKPGAIWGGQSGEAACDHYHCYRNDVALMKSLHVQAYRFSVAWPRVMPEGTGKINAKGVAFYDRLVDALLKAGIEPYVTLFHWDHPLALYRRGGWLNRDSASWFADYSAVVVHKLSDRVRFWITLNEPVCFIAVGLKDGTHAPGDRLLRSEINQAAHHALLGHGLAVQAIRANARKKPMVGYAPTGDIRIPATDSSRDIEAARRAMFEFTGPSLGNYAWWNDPIFLGRYPEDGLRVCGADAPRVASGDMRVIRQPLDFLGTNIYQGSYVRAGRDGRPETVALPVGYPITANQWHVTPEALYWGPRFLYERYGKPIYVTENGMTNRDVVSLDGRVHDPQRVDFLHRYLRELGRAAADGVDVRGYFLWTVMDNFEWAEGYKERFGIVYTDYPTQRRIPKDSAYWYRDTIAANGANL